MDLLLRLATDHSLLFQPILHMLRDQDVILVLLRLSKIECKRTLEDGPTQEVLVLGVAALTATPTKRHTATGLHQALATAQEKVCVCVCVCGREREREREKKKRIGSCW